MPISASPPQGQQWGGIVVQGTAVGGGRLDVTQGTFPSQLMDGRFRLGASPFVQADHGSQRSPVSNQMGFGVGSLAQIEPSHPPHRGTAVRTIRSVGPATPGVGGHRKIGTWKLKPHRQVWRKQNSLPGGRIAANGSGRDFCDAAKAEVPPRRPVWSLFGQNRSPIADVLADR
jgi:hypothetical protein